MSLESINFCDMTFEEITEKYLTAAYMPQTKGEIKNTDYEKFWAKEDDDDEEIFLQPSAPVVRNPVDWRAHFNPVEQTYDCGWAMGIAQTVAGNWHIANPTQPLTDFSYQQLYDCVTDGYSNGAYVIYHYTISPGLYRASDYPNAYSAGCQIPELQAKNAPIFKAKSVEINIDYANIDLYYTALSHGPIYVRTAPSKRWTLYKSGILTNTLTDCPSVYSAGTWMISVGWGILNGQEYVILRTMWGASFGENGYMRVAYQPNVNYSCFATGSCYRTAFK